MSKNRHPNFDLQTIKLVIKRAKILRLCSDVKMSKIPSKDGLICFADVPCPPDLSDTDTQAFYSAKEALVSCLTELSLDAVYDIIALMYLGRNGNFDGIKKVPVNRRFAAYDQRQCFKSDKQQIIKHMVGKCRLLDTYLEDGLRFMKWDG